PRESFEPIIECSDGPFSEVSFKPTLAAQSRKIVGPRSGNDNPCRSDLPLLDGLVTLQHERALASTESSVKSLHADENCRLIVASHLQRPHRRFAIDISRERFVQMDLHEYRPRGLIVGRRIRTLHRNLRLSMFARRRRTPRDYHRAEKYDVQEKYCCTDVHHY